MPELITANNITTEQSAALQAYLAQPYPTTLGDQALMALLEAAAGTIPLTRAQLVLNQGRLADSISYVDELRACNPTPGHLTPLDSTPIMDADIQSALENGCVHPTCYSACPVGLLEHHTGGGNRRIQCSMLRSAATKLSEAKETPRTGYVFEHLEDQSIAYILEAIMNGRRTGNLRLAPPYISALGISRELVFDYPNASYRDRIIRLGGVGIVSLDRSGDMFLEEPNPHKTVAQYIKSELPTGYTGMRTPIVMPNGKVEVTINETPLGAYTIEGARKKWHNTLIAREILGKTGIVLPEPVALMVNNSNGLAAVAYSYPKAGREISQVISAGNRVALNTGLQLIGRTLKTLHGAGFVHAQPGGNWTIYWDSKNNTFNVSLRDFGTMYSIRNYPTRQKKSAMTIDLNSVVGAALYVENLLGAGLGPSFAEENAFMLTLGYTGSEETARKVRKKVETLKRGYIMRDLERIFDTIFQ